MEDTSGLIVALHSKIAAEHVVAARTAYLKCEYLWNGSCVAFVITCGPMRANFHVCAGGDPSAEDIRGKIMSTILTEIDDQKLYYRPSFSAEELVIISAKVDQAVAAYLAR